METNLGGDAEAQILDLYHDGIGEVLALSERGDAEACMQRVFDLWMFMNRFRNCDLQKYFSEEIHDAINHLNPRRFDTAPLLTPKNEFNIAFILTNLVDTGGASVPHRFMLENPFVDGAKFNHYVLVSNLRNRDDFEHTESYRYLIDKIKPIGFEHMSAGLSWTEKGRFIEEWLHRRKIDFVVAAPCPATLYALASHPALVQGILSQDCYCFTLGPGAGDLTFLVTTDQLFKYRFKDSDAERRLKIMMLPLHTGDFIESAEPLTRQDLGVPEGSVVSGSTNMWKSCFGDEEILLEGIAALIRRFGHYHHVFAGTPRCRDNIEFFLSKNPDIRENVHFIGEVKNIYRLLKAIDFWVNSFPTSGGSDIECALVGKPTIEFLFNRNLTLHGAEFLRSRECDVVSIDEFVDLGSRFISDPDYREDLGAFLRQKITREFHKESIVSGKIYGSFLRVFRDRLLDEPRLPSMDLDRTLAYEKALALYNAHGRTVWDPARRWAWLERMRAGEPDRPFAWIKSIEETIGTESAARLDEIETAIPQALLEDFRVRVMLALARESFGDVEESLVHARASYALAPGEPVVRETVLRILVAAGHETEAEELVRQADIEGEERLGIASLLGRVSELTRPSLPLFYNF